MGPPQRIRQRFPTQPTTWCPQQFHVRWPFPTYWWQSTATRMPRDNIQNASAELSPILSRRYEVVVSTRMTLCRIPGRRVDRGDDGPALELRQAVAGE